MQPLVLPADVSMAFGSANIRCGIHPLGCEVVTPPIILGYPWMAAFEPQFTWKNGVISEKELPIILQSVNPFIPGKEPVIARIRGSNDNCRMRATTATELAIKAQQYTTKAEVPKEYRSFAKIFSEEESK